MLHIGTRVVTPPLELVLDDIKDYAVFLIDLNGRIATWNVGAQRVKGYTHDEAVGLPFAALFTEEDAAAGRPEHEMAVALEHGVYEGGGKRVRKDGSTFFAEVTLRLLRDSLGNPRAFVKVTRDVTERERARELERRAHREQRVRNEFEQQLIGIVSHDLRSPLNAILLSASALLRDAQEPAHRRGLARIVSSAQRSSRLISDLLDFTRARLGSGVPVKRVRVDLDEIVRIVVDEVRLSFPDRDVHLEQDGTLTGEWDADRLAQVVTNLVTNALKYGAKDKPVSVRSIADDQAVTIAVHNEGEPIPTDELPFLFEPMRRGVTNRPDTGSVGLGLFIVCEICRAHGGSVSAESSHEGGTTFTVRLPR